MGNWELKLIEAELERLLILAREDDALRTALRVLANSILDATGDPPPTPLIPEAPGATPRNEPLHALTLGRGQPVDIPPKPRPARPSRPSPAEELGPLADRCSLKAAAARRAAERVVDRAASVVAAADPDIPSILVDWTKRFEDAFYWTQHGESSSESDPRRLDELAGSYEELGAALRLVMATPDDARRLSVSLPLLAEAQSAVRVAHQRLGETDDHDQTSAFEWLKDAAARHRIFIPKFMRSDQQADPAAWEARLDRIEELASRRTGVRHSARFESLLAELRSLIAPIDPESAPHWSEAADVVDRLVSSGMPPSEPDLRSLLLPHLDEVPVDRDWPSGFLLTLREIDRYLATRRSPNQDAGAPGWSASVASVAERLEGRSLLLIGGQRRRDAQSALATAFRLASVVWLTTREHQSIASFEPAVGRPEIAVVLLAIRWSSHSFGEVKSLCDRHGKPLVRLPGGYGVNQVAEQILVQAGDRLST